MILASKHCFRWPLLGAVAANSVITVGAVNKLKKVKISLDYFYSVYALLKGNFSCEQHKRHLYLSNKSR